METIFTGLPVVSTPYMPAALMPMPCWPRLIRRRWNFEPYSSLPKISGICFLRMPGPLSCTPTLKRLVPVCCDVDPDLGQDAGLFAGVERVVDGFLDRGQQGLARIVEAEQVAVLGEELADRDIALAGGHRLGRGAAPASARMAVGRAVAGRLGLFVVGAVGAGCWPSRTSSSSASAAFALGERVAR